MKYRKKPVVIEAVQFTGENQEEIIAFTNGNAFMAEVGLMDKAMTIKTLESNRYTVSEGDFVIKGVQGEFYACKPDVFEETYNKEPEDKPHFEQLDDIDKIIEEGESESNKRIDLQEFVSEGYLQEANRRFFHPLGLALCISVDDEGLYKQVNLDVLDAREDPEGYYFDFKNRDGEYIEDSIAKMQKVSILASEKVEARLKLFGSVVEELG